MAQPSAQEQYLLELINRFRLNPAEEYDLLVNSGDADVESALNFFGVDFSVLASQWASLSAAQPLAWSEQLGSSALTHNQLMIANDQQSHNLPGEPSLIDRINNAGSDSYNAAAENIFAFSQSAFYAHAGFVIDWGDDNDEASDGFGTGIQTPAGHRNALLDNSYREVGLSIVEEGNPVTQVGPQVVTQHLANRETGADEWLLGVVFRDMDDDDFYSIGEGLGGVTVNIAGTNFSTSVQTGDAGGYQTLLPQGTYSIDFVQNGSVLQTYNNVVIGSESVKQDFFIEVGTAPTTGKGKIVGIQYNDANGNGIQDSGEVGLAGRSVYIDANNNRQFDSTELSVTTDADGVYIFNDLDPGEYSIAPVIPSNREQTSPQPDEPIGSETYLLDDGEQDGWLLLPGNALIFTQFETIAGQETLTSLSVGLSDRGNPTQLFIYQDADGDDAPDGDELILSVSPTLTGTEGFASVAISPTTVSGTFFVGTAYDAVESSSIVPHDTNSPDGRSWWASSSDPNSFSPNFYGASDWLLRANATGILSQQVSVGADETVGGINFGDIEVDMTVFGTPDDDTITGTPEADSIDGLAGNDTISGLAGNDTIHGGDGDDLLEGQENADNLSGGSGVDSLNGGNGNDTLNGDEGDDLLQGNDDADALFGGEGNDTLAGNSENDELSGDAGLDFLFGGDGADTLDGGSDSDVVRGGNGDDQLDGGIGDDTVSGEGGNDVVEGGSGRDFIYGGFGEDTLRGGEGNDLLFSGQLNDELFGGEGDDVVRGADGNDTLNGDAGNDTVSGEAGDDLARGGDGQDNVFGGGGKDTLYGEEDPDLLGGGGDDDELFGGSSDDTLRGDSGNDSLEGGTGDDAVVGGSGEDVLIGVDLSAGANYGAGEIDVLTGGTGADTFVLGVTGSATNVFYVAGTSSNPALGDYAFISDFVIGEDLIQLTNLGVDAYILEINASLSDVRLSGTGELIARLNGIGTGSEISLQDTNQFAFV